MRRLDLTCVILAAALLGCTDDGKSNDETETGGPTTTGDGDGDGDPSTGDGDGSPPGDGDGSPTTGDGDGDGDGDPTGDGDAAPPSECLDAADCVLVDDCCSCEVVPVGGEPPCDVPECFATTCAANGYAPQPDCRVGTCAAATVSCDLNQISCEIVEPPPCEGGLVRSVENLCYGPCVPPGMCEHLPFECDAGTCGDGYACVTTQSGAPSKCVPLPSGCVGAPSCECVLPWWDEVCGGGCGDAGETLLCEDGG